MHPLARSYFKVSPAKKTYLAEFNRKNLTPDSFDNLEHYALLQKDRKKAIQMYLYYPDTHANPDITSMIRDKCNDGVPVFLNIQCSP